MSRKPAPSPDSDSCSSCVHWAEDTEPGDERMGMCRRYPPAVVSDGESTFSLWPFTEADDRCGEFKRKVQ